MGDRLKGRRWVLALGRVGMGAREGEVLAGVVGRMAVAPPGGGLVVRELVCRARSISDLNIILSASSTFGWEFLVGGCWQLKVILSTN